MKFISKMHEINIENVWRKNNDRRLSLTSQSSEEHKEKKKEKKRKRNGQESALFCFFSAWITCLAILGLFEHLSTDT